MKQPCDPKKLETKHEKGTKKQKLTMYFLFLECCENLKKIPDNFTAWRWI